MPHGPSTNEKKRIVAEMLIRRAGDMVEFWNAEETNISADEVRDMMDTWLKNLPGDFWDIRLNHPSR